MWPNLGVKRVEGWMSIVRLGERVDLAHVIRTLGKRPAIRLCESFRVEGSPRETLSRLAQSKGLKRYRCASLLGEGLYRVAQLEAPAVPAEERVQALRWRLKDVVDFPVDGASVAVVDIPTEGGRQANVFAMLHENWRSRFKASHLSYTCRVNVQCQAIVKVHGVFLSCCG